MVSSLGFKVEGYPFPGIFGGYMGLHRVDVGTYGASGIQV